MNVDEHFTLEINESEDDNDITGSSYRFNSSVSLYKSYRKKKTNEGKVDKTKKIKTRGI